MCHVATVSTLTWTVFSICHLMHVHINFEHLYIHYLTMHNYDCQDALYVPTEIITSPQDQVAFLNQEVMFRCVTLGGDISGWLINETGYSDLPNAVRNDLKRSDKSLGSHDIHDLIMPGKADYNGTRIKLLIAVRGNEPAAVESETASLTLQGTQMHTCIYIYVSLKFKLEQYMIDS